MFSDMFIQFTLICSFFKLFADTCVLPLGALRCYCFRSLHPAQCGPLLSVCILWFLAIAVLEIGKLNSPMSTQQEVQTTKVSVDRPLLGF